MVVDDSNMSVAQNITGPVSSSIASSGSNTTPTMPPPPHNSQTPSTTPQPPPGGDDQQLQAKVEPGTPPQENNMPNSTPNQEDQTDKAKQIKVGQFAILAFCEKKPAE